MKSKEETIHALIGMLHSKGYDGNFYANQGTFSRLSAILQELLCGKEQSCQVHTYTHINEGEGWYVDCAFTISVLPGSGLQVTSQRIDHRKMDETLVVGITYSIRRPGDIASRRSANALVTFPRQKRNKGPDTSFASPDGTSPISTEK
jgi:hypothetical protein